MNSHQRVICCPTSQKSKHIWEDRERLWSQKSYIQTSVLLLTSCVPGTSYLTFLSFLIDNFGIIIHWRIYLSKLISSIFYMPTPACKTNNFISKTACCVWTLYNICRIKVCILRSLLTTFRAVTRPCISLHVTQETFSKQISALNTVHFNHWLKSDATCDIIPLYLLHRAFFWLSEE